MVKDPRLTPARDDLAAEYLKGDVVADHYVRGVEYQVVESSAPVRKSPRPDAALLTEAIYGEVVSVYEEHEGWVWGQLKEDGYVGYLPLQALSSQLCQPTHRIGILRTYVYPEPNIKSPPLDLLSLNSKLCVVGINGPFSQLNNGGFVYSTHLKAVDEYDHDFVNVAETLNGTPYLWGGKRSFGLDCSGLVQISLQACGKSVQRDSDMMQNTLGAEIPFTSDLKGLQRGDLVFWQGHIGIMCDSKSIIHSNGYHMATVIEPLTVARDRISSLFGEMTYIKRMSDYTP